MRAAFERSGERIELHFRFRQWVAGCFIIIWTIGWSAGCVGLIGKVIRDPRAFNFLFAIPFWAAWIVALFILLFIFFGREEFVLDHRGATFRSIAIVSLRTRFTPLDEIKGFEIIRKVVDSDSGRTQPLLEMRTMGRSLQFLQGTDLQELQWLRRQLNEHLDLLKQAVAYAMAGIPGTVPQAVAPPRIEPGNSQPLTLAERPIAPPSDSRWVYSEDIDDFTFIQSGRWSYGPIGGLLFVNLFWNGIVAVFLAPLLGFAPNGQRIAGIGRWGMFIFLIPFEAIGLTMFTYLLAALFEPVRRSSWTFAQTSIEYRLQWLGLGRTRRWEVVRLDRIEIRCDEKVPKRTFRASLKSIGNGQGDSGSNYRLQLIGRDNRALSSIDNLTEGEARWMGDVVLRQRREWFA
jgi:hypothetical protein